MIKRLFLLNGLAILAVVCNHSAHRGLTAMFWWTYRYVPDTAIPNWDQFGSLSHYALIAMIKLTFFAVPSFLFVSGFFIAYTARGRHSALSWRVVRVRITSLLIPYIIWSLVIFFGDWLQSCPNACETESLGEYLKILVTGGTYWYVPLVVQLYLLSFFLVPLAKTRWRLLLSIAALTQVGGLIVSYLTIFGVDVPQAIVVVFTDVLFPRDMIYSVFGIITGFHLPELKRLLARIKWGLLIGVVISAILTLIEAEFIFRFADASYDNGHIRSGYLTVPMTLYIISFIFCFLAFDKVSIPFSKILYQLGRSSYGIYLMHGIILTYFVPRTVYHLAPWILAYQILYQPVLIISAVGIPLLFASFVRRSRLRGTYRYLFG